MVDKDDLTLKIENYLKLANNDELDVLDQLIDGIIKKQNNDVRTFLNGAMNYSGHLISDDTYVAHITLNPFLMNPLDIVHGGITATLADTAMGTLVYLKLPEDKASVTSEIKVNYIKPGIGELLSCSAKMVHMGRHLCVVQSEITRGDGTLVAIASGSFFIIAKPK